MDRSQTTTPPQAPLGNSSASGNEPQQASSVAPASADAAGQVRSRAYWRLAFISAVVIVIVLLTSYSASRMIVALKPTPRRVEPVERVHTVQPYLTERITVQELIPSFGTARAMKSVVISAQVAGEIVETMETLRVGQAVHATRVVTGESGISERFDGDEIVRIDPQSYQRRMDQAEDLAREIEVELARLKQEETNLERRLKIQKLSFEEYEREYNRVKGLFDRNVVSRSELSAAELDLRRYEDAMVQLETELHLLPVRIRQAEAKLTTQRNEVELARLDLQRARVTSPISGHLSEVQVERGQYVRVGDPLVTVTSANQVEVPVGIPMREYLKLIPRINAGELPEAVLKTVNAGGQEGEWKGLVTRAAPMADPQTRTVDLFILVDNAQFTRPLLPGTFVTVAIDGPIYEDVIPIPRDTVYQQQVFVVEEGRAVRKTVEPIAQIESIMLVGAPLEAGEMIIMTNLDILQPGDAVRASGETTQSFRDELNRLRRPGLRILESGPARETISESAPDARKRRQ